MSIFNDNSRTNYDVGSEVIYHKEVSKSNLCDYNDANNLVKGTITNIGHQVKQLAFKIVHHLLNVL